MDCPQQRAQDGHSPQLTNRSLVVASIACWGHLEQPDARILPGRLGPSLPILPLLRLSWQVAGMLMMSAGAAICNSVQLLLLRCRRSVCSPGICGGRAHIRGIRLRLPPGQGEEAVVLCDRLRLLPCWRAAACGLCLAAGTCLLIIEACGGLRLQNSFCSVMCCV